MGVLGFVPGWGDGGTHPAHCLTGSGGEAGEPWDGCLECGWWVGVAVAGRGSWLVAPLALGLRLFCGEWVGWLCCCVGVW